jgi:FkbM family methyltransferase
LFNRIVGINMNEFVFNQAFRCELQESAHRYGEVAFLESVLRPGMVVIEVGANRGVTAVAIAKAVGKTGHVHAFEPVPEYFEVLEANIARNDIANISPYNLALSDRTGSLSFYKHGEGSGVTPVQDAGKIQVEAITLPDFLSACHVPGMDFINLDCEGSELLIFRNARAVLKDYGPPIFCEVHRQYLQALGHSVEDAVSFLSQIGYSVNPIQVEDLSSPSDFDHCSHLYASYVE